MSKQTKQQPVEMFDLAHCFELLGSATLRWSDGRKMSGFELARHLEKALDEDGCVPFTMHCAECDMDCEADSQLEAESIGWAQIEIGLDMPSANYSGLCPECDKLSNGMDEK